MSSDRSLPRLIAPLAMALLLAVGAGCGRKQDPEPPPQKNPARTNDLKVQQRGQTLYVTMTYPSLTLGGLALPGIDRIDYDRYVRPAPEFMEVPPELQGEAAEGEGETGEAGTAEEMPAEGTAAETAAGEEAAEEETEAEEGREESEEVAPAAETSTEVEVEEMETVEAETPTRSAAEVEGSEASEGERTAETASEGESGQAPQEGAATAMSSPAVPINPFLQIRVDLDEFKKHKEEVLVLEGTELESAVVGGLIVARFPLEDVPTLPPVAYSFQVQTYSGHLRSPESNIASFVPLPPPLPPTEVALEPGSSGIRLHWVQPEGVHIVQPPPPMTGLPGAPGSPSGSGMAPGMGAPSGRGPAAGGGAATGASSTPETEPVPGREAAPSPSTYQGERGAPPSETPAAPTTEPLEAEGAEQTVEESTGASGAEAMGEATGGGETGPADEEGIPLTGYNIYRQLEGSSLYGAPIATLPPDQTDYLDSAAAYGSSYTYAVTAVRMRQPLVESELSEELTVDYQDVFAPRAPSGLVLLAEVGRIRLVWQANPESDLDGYLVFVRQADGERQQLTPEPIPGNEYIHRGTTSGATYTYSVVAVDASGNHSEPSEEATTRAP